MIGKTVSHYEILEKLGQGGMGVVYKAHDLDLDRFVALKFLPPHATADHELNARFVNEAHAAAALDHPNVGTIYEIGRTEEQAFIAMAYIEGEDIAQRVRSGPLDVDEALAIAIQSAEGLSAAHAEGIVHRDIKSANIMVTSGGVAKVMDFGLAKMSEATQMTRDGAAVGTASYMSPEQSQGGAIDHRTDIWSLGAVLYEMLTGRRPFGSEQVHAVMYAIVNEPHKPITDLRDDLPADLARVVDGALAKDPAGRYQDILDFAADLQALRQGSVPGAMPRSVTRRWSLLVGASMVVVAAVAVAVGLFFGKESSAHTRTVVFEDEEGQTVERTVPNPKYLERMTLYFFDNESGDPQLDWMQYAITDLVHTDLGQDMFVVAHYAYEKTMFGKGLNVYDHLKAAGHENALDVPVALQRRIAGDKHTEHFVSGALNGSGDALTATARVYETKTGRVVDEETFDGDLFGIADRISLWIRETVGVPASHVEETPDLPISDMTTASVSTFQTFIEGANAFIFEEDMETAIEKAEEAIDEDESFVSARMLLAVIKVWHGDFEEYGEQLEEVMKYLHKIPESLQFAVKSAYFEGKGQTEKQVAVLRMATEVYPEDLTSHMSLASVLEATNQLPEAISVLMRVTEIQPEYSEAYLAAARMHRQLGENEAALPFAQEYATRYPEEAKAHVELGGIYEELGQHEDAKTHFEKADLLDPGQTDVLLSLSSVESKLGNQERAAQHLTDVIGTCESDGRTYRAIAEFLADSPDYREVLNRYEEDVRDRTDDVVALSALGRIYGFIGDKERQRSAYARVVELKPQDQSALRGLAYLEHTQFGNTAEAEALYDRALGACQDYSNKLSVWKHMRTLSRDQGRISHGIEYLEKMTVPPEDDIQSKAVALVQLARCIGDYVEAGQNDRGLEKQRELQVFFKPMSALPAIQAVLLVGELNLQLAAKDTLRALETADQLVKIFDESTENFRRGWRQTVPELQARAYTLAGDYEAAIGVYERLREDEWSDDAYASHLGYCYLKMEQYEQARSWMSRSLETHAYKPLTNYRAALAHEGLGDREKALEHLKRCLDMWSEADANYQPAIEARAKLAEWAG